MTDPINNTSPDDPRKAIVEVMARLGRETQLHIDERTQHFQVTDKVIKRISILLLIVAVVNVTLVWVLSKNMDSIVNNMDSMRLKLIDVDEDMTYIAKTVDQFDEHTAYMHTISNNIGMMTSNLPLIRINMDSMTENMLLIDKEMEGMKLSISSIDTSMRHMTIGMAGMEYSVRQFSKPMGVFNPVIP